MVWSEFRLTGGGTLRLREEGELVYLEVSGADDGRGLYKAYVHGIRGEMLLGTLCPGSNGPELVRRVSKRQLERCGCWPVTGGACILTFPFERHQDRIWQQEVHPEQLVGDVVLREALKNRTMLLKRQEHGFCLAAVFDAGHPFPLTPLFCLSRIHVVEGRTCAVFYFDREGNPVAPYNEDVCGENSGRI